MTKRKQSDELEEAEETALRHPQLARQERLIGKATVDDLAILLGLDADELRRTWERARMRGGPDACRTANPIEWVRRLIELEARRMGRPLMGPRPTAPQQSDAREPEPLTPEEEQERERRQRAFELGKRGLCETTTVDPGPVTPYEKAVTRGGGAKG
jgi:hypothetical protein